MKYNFPFVLIDTSYCVYFAGFSAWKWYESEFDTSLLDSSFDPILDDEFKSEFISRFKYKLNNVLFKKEPFYSPEQTFFCIDCKLKDNWRTEYYPKYKLKRYSKNTKKFSWSGIYEYVYNIFIPTLCQEMGYHTLKALNAEADDIIGVFCENYAKKSRVLIISSDTDLYQLKTNTVKIVNLNLEEMDEEKIEKSLNLPIKINPKSYLSIKTMIGDTADEIKPIFKRCGKKTALKLLQNKEKFKTLMNENLEAKQNLIRNNKLINLNYIPNEIKSDILKQIDLELTGGRN